MAACRSRDTYRRPPSATSHSPFSNRQIGELESLVSYRKQRTGTQSNRQKTRFHLRTFVQPFLASMPPCILASPSANTMSRGTSPALGIYTESPATPHSLATGALLIAKWKIRNEPNLHKINHIKISNREKTRFHLRIFVQPLLASMPPCILASHGFLIADPTRHPRPERIP